jgi:hypothetical protein
MKSIQIKDLPEHLYIRLSQKAEIERRSLAQQAIIALASGLGVDANPRKKREETLSRIANRKQDDVSLTTEDPVIFIREDRER